MSGLVHVGLAELSVVIELCNLCNLYDAIYSAITYIFHYTLSYIK